MQRLYEVDDRACSPWMPVDLAILYDHTVDGGGGGQPVAGHEGGAIERVSRLKVRSRASEGSLVIGDADGAVVE